jgi:hypothetical protein
VRRLNSSHWWIFAATLNGMAAIQAVAKSATTLTTPLEVGAAVLNGALCVMFLWLATSAKGGDPK